MQTSFIKTWTSTTISLKFILNDVESALQAACNAAFKMQPMEQRFYVRCKRLAPEIVEVHRQFAAKCGYRIPITKVATNMHDVSGAAKEISSLVPSDNVPSRVVLA
jgi:uncharacterized protein with PhoU and TrkA domain